MRSIRVAAVGLFICTLVSCEERRLPLQPALPDPAFQIQDAVHSSGNWHFFFLPPLVPQPRFSGVLDPHELPVVTLCRWTGMDCGRILWQVDHMLTAAQAQPMIDAAQTVINQLKA